MGRKEIRATQGPSLGSVNCLSVSEVRRGSYSGVAHKDVYWGRGSDNSPPIREVGAHYTLRKLLTVLSAKAV